MPLGLMIWIIIAAFSLSLSFYQYVREDYIDFSTVAFGFAGVIISILIYRRYLKTGVQY